MLSSVFRPLSSASGPGSAVRPPSSVLCLLLFCAFYAQAQESIRLSLATADAAAARRQAAGVDQVGRAVGEMDRVTQQNAASAEESSSAASELSGQAEELAAMVGSFRLERDGRARDPAAPPRHPAAAGPSGRALPGRAPLRQ